MNIDLYVVYTTDERGSINRLLGIFTTLREAEVFTYDLKTDSARIHAWAMELQDGTNAPVLDYIHKQRLMEESAPVVKIITDVSTKIITELEKIVANNTAPQALAIMKEYVGALKNGEEDTL
jgi:serine/threonine-protein kinase RIO1